MNKPKIILIVIFAAIIATVTVYSIKQNHHANMTAVTEKISAGQAILINGNTGDILYEKSAEEKAYPASTTKIMTALIVLETLDEYDSPINQMVTVPATAEGVEGSSIYLKRNERISIEDLLYGLMLVSGNDAAVALAEIVGGSQEKFVEMMNDKAEELGCHNTHFANPNGLFDENHYTTAKDMSVIAKAAMANPKFRDIVGAQSWDATSRQNDYVHFANKNKTVHQYEGGNGVKIGYTKTSGRTLVASAERGGESMICVVMSAPDWFNDAYKLMDYGFGGEEK